LTVTVTVNDSEVVRLCSYIKWCAYMSCQYHNILYNHTCFHSSQPWVVDSRNLSWFNQ